MPSATGTFKVLGGQDDAYHEEEGEPRLAVASGTQRFSGDIEADGEVHWLACYRPDKTARLIGLQHIDGSVGGRTGTFLIEAQADHDGRASKGTWTVVSGTGTGGLAGISGSGSFEAAGPEASYRLEYEID